MKIRLTLFAALTCLITTQSFALSGGPDLYGYTWMDSNEPGGPTYNWIDISSVGTQITAFTDDNGITNIPMGMSFHYYWTDYTQVSIGSNGWISFNNVSNIASCFPTLPTAGGVSDNIIAPFMSDLIFTGAGNPAEAYYYHDAVNDRFIISFIDVPWWTSVSPTWIGSNTFQVIFDNADSSITFNYGLTDQVNYNAASCTGVGQSGLEIGIENLTGNIGLQVYHATVPPSNYAVKFYYPPVVTYQVIDPNSNWNMNAENKAKFHATLEDITLSMDVKNVGNTAVSSPISVSATVTNSSSATVYTSSSSVSSLLAGDDSLVVFSGLFNATTPGQYTFTSSITNSGDLNNTNNSTATELRLVDTTNANIVLTYSAGGSNNGSISWTGGGGGTGVFYEPPLYPVIINSVEAYIINGITGAGSYKMEVLDDDGPSGSPGTVLASMTVPTGSYSPNQWVATPLPSPITVNNGGFYVSWQMLSADSVAIGTETVAPFSRQNYEYLGSWETFRYNEINDLMIKANVTYPYACSFFSTTVDSVHHISCNGANDGEIFITYNGGLPNYSVTWTNGANSGSGLTGLGGGIYNITVTDSVGCQTTHTVGLIEPMAMTLSGNTTDEMIANDGTIDLTVTGSFGPYIYDWDNDGVGDNDDTQDLTGLAAGTYVVIVTDGNGCSQTMSFIVGSQVGIEELAEMGITLYPNPADDKLNVQFENAVSGTISLHDLSGRQIMSEKIAASLVQLDVTGLSAGTYILQFSNEKHTARQLIEIK